MRKNLFICFLLCSLTAFSCGPSSDEINRITAENTRLKEENMALITELEQCKSELETLKKTPSWQDLRQRKEKKYWVSGKPLFLSSRANNSRLRLSKRMKSINPNLSTPIQTRLRLNN